MTPLVDHYGTAKHRSYGLIRQNIVVLFQGVRVGFKCTTFLRSLTAGDLVAQLLLSLARYWTLTLVIKVIIKV